MQLLAELCEMSGSARSVLAHQGLCCIGDLMRFAPRTVLDAGPGALGGVADCLLDSCKKNKPKVIRERARTILEVKP